jgi:hypothetical protein
MSLLSGLEQLLSNLKTNVTHPQNIVSNAVHDARAIGRVISPATTQENNLPPRDAWGFSGPNLNNPVQNPLSLGRIQGTAAASNASGLQNWTDMFKNIVMGAHPYVGQSNQPTSIQMARGAGGEYLPELNQIVLKGDQLDPYTVTHEGLHAAFQRKTPQAQAGFYQLAQTASPLQQQVLNSPRQLGSPIYHGRKPLTEVHSYLPQFSSSTSPQLAHYYNNYFTDPNFRQQQNARHDINMAINPPPVGQFSDWMDN